MLLLHGRGAVTELSETFPRNPVLKPWYRLLHEEDRVLLQYGEILVAFEGAASRRLLPALLPLLDGARSLEEIVLILGTPVRRAVERALGLLHEHGLLTEPLPEVRNDGERRSAEFLAATGPSGTPPGRLLDALRTVVVGVAGSGSLAAEVTSALHRSGVAELEALSLCADTEKLSGLDIALAAPAGEELPDLRSWNESALAARVPWLQVLPFDGLLAVVGPFFVPGETGCHECFRIRRGSNVDYGPEFLALQEVGAPLPAPASLDQTVAGLAATLVLRRLAQADQFLPGTWYALELGMRPALQPHVLYRVPRCPACSGLDQTAQPLPWHRGAAAA